MQTRTAAAAGVAVLAAAVPLVGGVLYSFPNLWRGLFLAASLLSNAALVVYAVVVTQRASSLGAYLAASSRASPLPESANGVELDAAQGLQRLLDQCWPWCRTWAAGLKPRVMIKKVSLGQSSPRVKRVRAVEAPEEGVVCSDVDVVWTAGDDPPAVDLSLNVPGCAEALVFRLKLLYFEGTMRAYNWSSPPAGRGNGLPFSLVEVSLAEGAPHPPSVNVELEALTPSILLRQMVPRLQQVAASVIEGHLLQRFEGFRRRVKCHENLPREFSKGEDEDAWKQAARRAGWLPRAEAEIESAVAEMARRAGDYAFEAAAGAQGRLSGTLRAGLEAGERAKNIVTDAGLQAGERAKTLVAETAQVKERAIALVSETTLQGTLIDALEAGERAKSFVSEASLQDTLRAGYEVGERAKSLVSGAAAGAVSAAGAVTATSKGHAAEVASGAAEHASKVANNTLEVAAGAREAATSAAAAIFSGSLTSSLGTSFGSSLGMFRGRTSAPSPTPQASSSQDGPPA